MRLLVGFGGDRAHGGEGEEGLMMGKLCGGVPSGLGASGGGQRGVSGSPGPLYRLSGAA